MVGAAIVLLLLVSSASVAQVEKRLALLIGNQGNSIKIADVQAVLRDDEALLLFFDTDDGFEPIPEETFIWVVSKTDTRGVRLELGTAALQREVSPLRCGLDRDRNWSWDAREARWQAQNAQCRALRPAVGRPAKPRRVAAA